MGNQRISVCAAALVLAAAVGITGCGGRNSPAAPPNGRATAQNAGPGMSFPDGEAARERAVHLETLARGVNGVRDANCVVFGRYAIVGIDVDPKMERSRVGTVKYAVAEALRKDPRGADALVTADVDLAQRLREIRADVARGRPVAGFAEELADIVGRLVPQMPRSVVPPQSPANTGAPNARTGGR